jgi:alkylation response protein AidB-like acyl-CoA dehydrogenase
MATQQAKSKPDYAPPPIDGDFYRITTIMNESERALLKRVREFTEGVIAPVIEDYWSRDAFPFEIIPKMAEVGIGGVGYEGYGAAGGSWRLNGLVAMELARVDSSVATFWGRSHGPLGWVDLSVWGREAKATLNFGRILKNWHSEDVDTVDMLGARQVFEG